MSSTLAATPASSGQTSPRRQIFLSNTKLLYGAVTVLLLAPLAFGAVEPWAIFALELCAAVLLAGWGVRQWMEGEIEFIPHPLYAPALAFVTLALLQSVTGTTSYRHATSSQILLYLGYGMLAFVVTQTLRRGSQLRMLAWALCIYGAVVALFALLEGIAPNGKLYWIWGLEQGGSVYGPYVNRNHYAGLMELLAPIPLALAASRWTHGNRKLVVVAIAALMAGTVFLSGSRGGMLSLALQIVVLVVLLRPRQKDWKQGIALIVFLAVIVGLLVWLGGNELTRRLASIHTETTQELSGGVRLTIARDSLRMWLRRPVLGWGLGTFPVVYPQFRSFYTTFFINQAHNDYAQLLVETGLVGLAIAVWFLVLTFRRALAKLDNWTETANGTLTVAALVGCIGILVHSFMDFNLQIPANAALFYALCAIAASGKFQESVRQRRRSRAHALILDPKPVSETD